MELYRTHNMAIVNEILTHPALWPLVAGDSCGEPEDFHVRYGSEKIFLLARDDERTHGIVSFHPRPWPSVYEGHLSPMPGFGGARAVKMLERAFDWVWGHTDASVIIGAIPASNPAMSRIARWAGMEPAGQRLPGQFRNGRWEHENVFRIERPVAIGETS